MKKLVLFSFSFLVIYSCVTNPMTGRTSLQMQSDGEINQLSATEYTATLKKYKVEKGTVDAERVKNIGTRIANAAAQYYRNIGKPQALNGYQWEFNLLVDKQVNAWCMPGGKVGVYTGILPVAKDDNGLAVVLSHEISHALAGHGNERLSQSTLLSGIGQIAGGSIGNAETRALFDQLYPIGSQVGMLSYGRKQETEADRMGLYLMAMAGFDPRKAPDFWDRMSAVAGASSTPTFLSTHPNPANRKKDLQAEMPIALRYYRAAGGQ